MLANLVKRCFSSKMDLGSSLFKQKRELHKWDAFSTYMQPPKNIVEIDPTQVCNIYGSLSLNSTEIVERSGFFRVLSR